MNTIQSLKETYREFKNDHPKLRIRDIATKLEVSEAELLMTNLGESVTLLEGDFEELLKKVPSLGYVMALTRNDHCVHERKGEYKKVSFNRHVGLVLGEDIDLRLFMSAWHHAFAVEEGERKSLQFFNKKGNAVHKIYLTDKSNTEAFNSLVNEYRKESQDGFLLVSSETTGNAVDEKPDEHIDVSGFQQAWLDMKDTHEFFGLLKKFGVARMQGLRLAPEGFTKEISIDAFKEVMGKCSSEKADIMVFVGNDGCIQIHTGKAERLVQTGPWFNVLDPEFNMHLREDSVAKIWLVKKPTADGVVTSLELFDSAGELIVQFFGKRKPGIPESEHWRNILRLLF